jgi:hypothetical protein
MFAPVPLATTTWVLSIITWRHAPPTYLKASVRKILPSKRWKVGYIWKKSRREKHRTDDAVRVRWRRPESFTS